MMNWKKIVLRKEGLRMSMRKWLSGMVVLLMTFVVVTVSGSLNVFAEISAL